MLLSEKNRHGGDIYTHRGFLDFSANINPFGMPEKVRLAAARAVGKSEVYPDPYCRALREKLAAAEGVLPEHVLCGNGAAELIYAFAYALPKDKPALIVGPTFCEYEAALSAAGIPVAHYLLPAENGFAPDTRIPDADLSAFCALILCTPNNPTGKCVDPALLEELCARADRLFADLCFLDLTDAPGRYGLPALLKKYKNLVALRALTKSFAMPGLRLGYALSCDKDFLSAMAQKTQSWNVSLPAQAAGSAATDCAAWLRACVSAISAERARLAEALEALGVKVYPGEANFLLLHSEKDLYGALYDKKILVRDCGDIYGLGKGYVRIAVRLPKENDRLLAAVKEVLS